MVRAFFQFVGLAGAAILAAFVFVIIGDIQRLQEDIAYIRPHSTEIIGTMAETVSPLEESPVVSAPIVENQPAAAAQSQKTESDNEVHRIKNPYAFASKPDAELYAVARAAIVNIYCQSRGSLSSISGSGVVIDPRGVILTNAHVAQYMLLETDPNMKLECFIRTGSPSQNRYKAELLFLPTPWITEHAADIAAKRPTGTGEHDYALLRIIKTLDGYPSPNDLPYLPFDTREAIAFASDEVLLAGYPAEFTIKSPKGSTLYPTSVFTRIGELLTFGERSIDLVSLGGAVLAQSGSSGGAMVNLWGQLVGIISTTSDGATTAERELRAITLSYVNRDLKVQTNLDLAAFLASDLTVQGLTFMDTQAPILADQLTENL